MTEALARPGMAEKRDEVLMENVIESSTTNPLVLGMDSDGCATARRGRDDATGGSGGGQPMVWGSRLRRARTSRAIGGVSFKRLEFGC